MAEFFIELFSEEIPARMQADATAQLERICALALKPLNIVVKRVFYGPRRIALSADVAGEVSASGISERGPRLSAPEQALAGFLRKHGAKKEDLANEGDFWVLNKQSSAQPAAAFIAAVLPEALAKLPWPKSMRWGSGGEFAWVRPLRRAICLLDGTVVPIVLGPVVAGNVTEGHRVHAKGPFEVSSVAVWEEKLREHYVIADQTERRAKITEGIAAEAAKFGLSVVPDDGLLNEVTGLVEWPVALVGKIEREFMELPPEVRELSMKSNQKYFALRDETGVPVPYFAFVANLAADDEGAAIIAGNERVLRARLADARHFWALDIKTPLDRLLPKLEKITFHAKIGTQRQRADRIANLAEEVARALGGTAEEVGQAGEAGLLAKADLVTGMVGEFPELQGVMGGYYAARGRSSVVGRAISTHYQPKGPSDDVPTGIVAIAVALADKLDTLREFFAIGEKPTGSGDPFALRRCALGVIRIVLENDLRLHLMPFTKGNGELFAFIVERLRVKLRGEGKRFDVLDAVLASSVQPDDDLLRLMKRVEALEIMLSSEDGKNLLVAYKRAANILKIESAKDGPYEGAVHEGDLMDAEERALNVRLQSFAETLGLLLLEEDFLAVMTGLATLRPVIDAFFANVTVNAKLPELRRNRLRLLARFKGAVDQVADFSRIEG
ncbi:glycine--tRNA ligase subunit beta [Acidocella sp.]|uniref:glycine--tRNA ligase subunit beta n=1 Tax=Acidocella sp. TaxID=50710 RepID=UPI002623C360|nr:glycine--tRNA ligase subunit beta [Acidocella sp.]